MLRCPHCTAPWPAKRLLMWFGKTQRCTKCGEWAYRHTDYGFGETLGRMTGAFILLSAPIGLIDGSSMVSRILMPLGGIALMFYSDFRATRITADGKVAGRGRSYIARALLLTIVLVLGLLLFMPLQF